MIISKGAYAFRGAVHRTRVRNRRLLLAAGLVGSLGALMYEGQPDEAHAEAPGADENDRLRAELDSVSTELRIVSAKLTRKQKLFDLSRQYKISADLAKDIYDAAVETGIDPELAFRVVRVESQFKERATSPVGAIGLTQIMPGTARYFAPNASRAELYDRQVNLNVGLRYLRTLLVQYKGDVKLALLAYNRGPGTVENLLAQGLDPANGYDRMVLRGYVGKGLLE